jgi:hypothetical protein
MTTALVILTVIEVAIVVGVLAAYLVLIDRHLRVISAYLGKLAFGVRAVETQTSPIGPSVLRINATLREIDAALGPIVEKAKQAAEVRG